MIEKKHVYLITIGDHILTTQSEDDHIHFYTIDDITEAIKTKQFIQQYTDKKVDYHIMHKSELTDMHHIKLLFEKGGSQNDQRSSKRTRRKSIPRQ